MGRGAKPVTRTFGVVTHAVCINFIDLANKDVIIEKIRAKNAVLIQELEIKWIGWLFSLAPGKKESLVVECKTAIQANGAIDEGLAIGADLHWCIIYNTACK